jgi:hypothetical protein
MRAPLSCALALLLAGCTQHTDLIPADGGTDACPAPGPPIALEPSTPCAGALAASTFRYALCSCAPLLLAGDLVTDRLAVGPPQMMRVPAAAVGTDDVLLADGFTQIAGALVAAGPKGLTLANTAVVFGNLHSGGPLATMDLLTVGGDAFAAGDVMGRIDIRGVLHTAPGVIVGPLVSASGFVEEPVMVAPPCGCATPRLDVPTLVAARSATNDDGAAGLAPDALAGATTPAAIDLPCGQFFLKSIAAPSPLELRVHGRAALFVGGDVKLAAGLTVTLDPGAELDLLIAGDLALDAGTLGASVPALMRVWISGAAVDVADGASLSAFVYAPAATLTAARNLTGSGGVFAQALSLPGDVSLHYDPQILLAGVECGAAPERPVE